MMKRLNVTAAFIVLFLISVVSTDASAEDEKGRLIWPKLLEHAKLKTLWKRNLPLMKKEKLKKLVVLKDNIYALTEKNYLFALDRHNGNHLFDKSLAPKGFTVLGMKLSDNQLISVLGNKIVQLDPENGKLIDSMDLDFGVTCLADRNKSYLYVAGADKLLHVYRAKDKVRLFEISSGDYTRITSVLAVDNLVVFSTAGGRVVSIKPDQPVKKWQYEARDGIVGPMRSDEKSLLFASEDTYLYRLPLHNVEKSLWKFQTRAILNKAPQVTDNLVYQYVNGYGLAAVNKQTGKLIWMLNDGLDLLAQTEDKAYIFKKNGRLVVMDNVKGGKLYSVNFAGITRYATNVNDAKIYVADDYGHILCLEPEE